MKTVHLVNVMHILREFLMNTMLLCIMEIDLKNAIMA